MYSVWFYCAYDNWHGHYCVWCFMWNHVELQSGRKALLWTLTDQQGPYYLLTFEFYLINTTVSFKMQIKLSEKKSICHHILLLVMRNCFCMIKFGKFSVTYPEWVIIGTVERLTKVGLGSFILFLSSVNEWMFSNLKLLFLSMEFGGLVKSNIIAISVFCWKSADIQCLV